MPATGYDDSEQLSYSTGVCADTNKARLTSCAPRTAAKSTAKGYCYHGELGGPIMCASWSGPWDGKECAWQGLAYDAELDECVVECGPYDCGNDPNDPPCPEGIYSCQDDWHYPEGFVCKNQRCVPQ